MSYHTYMTADCMWRAALRELMNRGQRTSSRAGDAVELIGWHGRLAAGASSVLLCDERRSVSHKYAAAELLWYMGRDDDITLLKRFAPQYERFAPEGTAHGAYGARIARNGVGGDQLDRVAAMLRDDHHTRQAVVTLWTANDLWCTKQPDLPCTLSWQFLRRRDQLHMHVTMRSNDVWLGMPYDVFCFSQVQALVASSLDLRVGDYVHSVGSMHLYEKNEAAARESLLCECAVSQPVRRQGLLKNAKDCYQLALNETPSHAHGDCLLEDVLNVTCGVRPDLFV